MRDAEQFWRDKIGTDFTEPCWKCGRLPAMGDVWRIEVAGEVIREGHAECFMEVSRERRATMPSDTRTLGPDR
jgi:hypothetical protein